MRKNIAFYYLRDAIGFFFFFFWFITRRMALDKIMNKKNIAFYYLSHATMKKKELKKPINQLKHFKVN